MLHGGQPLLHLFPSRMVESMDTPLLVTSYRDPDLDGVACSVAYAECLRAQGQEAVATILGIPHLEARQVAKRFGIALPSEVDPRAYEKIVLVDTSVVMDQDAHLPLERVVEIIDHRALHEAEKFRNAKTQIELVGSAATLVAERFAQANLCPSEASTFLLFGAIASNTINFQAQVTTERDRNMATWLRSLYAIPEDFVEVMFREKSHLEGPALKETLLGDFSYRTFGDLVVGIGQLEIIQARELIEARREELLTIIHELRLAYPQANRVFISVIDVVRGENIFLVPEADVRAILGEILDVTFDEQCIARRTGILMRKEIGPLWKTWHENHTRR